MMNLSMLLSLKYVVITKVCCYHYLGKFINNLFCFLQNFQGQGLLHLLSPSFSLFCSKMIPHNARVTLTPYAGCRHYARCFSIFSPYARCRQRKSRCRQWSGQPSQGQTTVLQNALNSQFRIAITFDKTIGQN